MKHAVWLALLLGVFWLINSGHFDFLLLSLGAGSVVLVMLVNRRMARVNEEYYPPVLMTLRLPGYLAWLAWEIIKSNVDVVRRIWSRHPAISPRVFTVKASQRTDACKVLYANSITMTPGTVTLKITGDEFEVHALTRAAAEGLASGGMDRHVRNLED